MSIKQPNEFSWVKKRHYTEFKHGKDESIGGNDVTIQHIYGEIHFIPYRGAPAQYIYIDNSYIAAAFIAYLDQRVYYVANYLDAQTNVKIDNSPAAYPVGPEYRYRVTYKYAGEWGLDAYFSGAEGHNIFIEFLTVSGIEYRTSYPNIYVTRV